MYDMFGQRVMMYACKSLCRYHGLEGEVLRLPAESECIVHMMFPSSFYVLDELAERVCESHVASSC